LPCAGIKLTKNFGGDGIARCNPKYHIMPVERGFFKTPILKPRRTVKV